MATDELDDHDEPSFEPVGHYESRTGFRTYNDHLYAERWWWGIAQREMQQRSSFTGRYREET